MTFEGGRYCGQVRYVAGASRLSGATPLSRMPGHQRRRAADGDQHERHAAVPHHPRRRAGVRAGAPTNKKVDFRAARRREILLARVE